jgi:predicted GNAT family N-acyltransferase
LGLVFAFELHGQVIGTIRMMPLRHGLTLTEQLLKVASPDSLAQWPNSWDAGRLVVAPEYRVGQEVLKRCLHLTLTDLLATTDVQHLLGSCTHVLSRLYRRFGFTSFAQKVPLAGTEKCYTLIHGEVANVAQALDPSREASVVERGQ